MPDPSLLSVAPQCLWSLNTTHKVHFIFHSQAEHSTFFLNCGTNLIGIWLTGAVE